MDPVIGVGVLVVINIGVAAYSYGKLSQKVSDLCRRVGRLEDAHNPYSKDKPEEEKK